MSSHVRTVAGFGETCLLIYAVIQAVFRCIQELGRFMSESISDGQLVVGYIVSLAVAGSRNGKKEDKNE